ncbi:MAG: family 10 glycosylhydrolase [Leptolyngbyaceae bacterium]|nr:family 10 glycosylhydrolase [Leptolyngbyaceae bacterium]
MNQQWGRQGRWSLVGAVLVGAIALGVWLAPSWTPGGWSFAQPSPPPSGPSGTPPTELRGVWLTNIDSSVLFSRNEIQYGLQRLAQLHFNTIYPTVWNWGYTLYPSAIAQSALGEAIDPHLGLQDRDLLQELVDQSHHLGLSVMPWFEFGLMTPSYAELARRHPSWIGQRQDGSTVVMQGRHPRKWLNPLHPGVQQLMVGIITEVVQRYEVDGIQLDDHFGMPVELGYDPYTVAYYQETHGGQDPPTDVNDPDWVQWRADMITQLMGQIVTAVRQINPNCHISLSPNPQPFARDQFLQDWEAWQRLGYLDDLIIQVYRGGMESFEAELDRPRLQAIKGQLPISIGILTGLRNRPTDDELIVQQVQASRDRAFSGVSFFFYESLGDRKALFQRLFPTPASRPNEALSQVR